MDIGFFRVQRERGAAAMEFALAVSLFMTMLFALVDVGRLAYTQNALTAATQEGARILVAAPDTPLDTLTAKMLNRVVGLSPSALSVTVDHPEARMVEVRATYTYRAITPLPFFDRVTLRAATRMRY